MSTPPSSPTHLKINVDLHRRSSITEPITPQSISRNRASSISEPTFPTPFNTPEMTPQPRPATPPLIPAKSHPPRLLSPSQLQRIKDANKNYQQSINDAHLKRISHLKIINPNSDQKSPK